MTADIEKVAGEIVDALLRQALDHYHAADRVRDTCIAQLRSREIDQLPAHYADHLTIAGTLENAATTVRMIANRHLGLPEPNTVLDARHRAVRR